MHKISIDLEKLLSKALFSRAEIPPKKIRKIRKSYGMTQVNFADLILVNYETYRSWEEGRRIPSSPGAAILFIAEKHPKIFIDNRKEILSRMKGLI